MHKRRLKLKTIFFNYLREVFKIPFLEHWLVSKTTGKGITNFYCRLIPAAYSYPKPSWRTARRDELMYKLDISNSPEHNIFFGFSFTKGFEIFLSLLDPGVAVVDVGAHVGGTALRIAKKIQPGKVIAFEPDPNTFKKLKNNIALNPQYNIDVYNFGLSNKENKLNLVEFNSYNLGMNRLRENTLPGYNSNKVQLKTFDDLFQNIKIQAIKIDVEGHELKVLQGALQAIETNKPILLIELNDNNLKEQGDSALNLVMLLESYNYKIKDAHSLKSITSDSSFENLHIDILCTFE